MRRKPTLDQVFERHLLGELPGLSADHTEPLVLAWHEAAWHPHMAGLLSRGERLQRLADRLDRDRRAGVAYARALHGAGIDEELIDQVALTAHAAMARALLPWYARLPVPDRLRSWFARR